MRQKRFYEYPLIVLMIVLVIAMSVLKWQYKDVVWEETKPSLTMLPSPTTAPQINVEYPLWEKLPYKGIDYIVERYTEPNTLLIKTVEGVDKEMINEEIYNWMRENKVATESHRLIFEEN